VPDEKQQAPQPSSSSSSEKGKGSRRGPHLAPTQDTYEPPGPPERTAGTPEHLGSPRPYEGEVNTPEAADR
jgi:hypothetical protein